MNFELKTLTLDSREVAKMLGKEHKHLLRDIAKNMEYLTETKNGLSEITETKIGLSEFFQENQYKDSTGRKVKRYDITKKGCEFLAHKLTGKKGAIFTATYINKFHEMEQQLANPKLPFEEETKIIPTTWRGQPVMELSVFTKMTGVPKGFTTYYYKKEIITLTGNDLANYKKENGISKSYPKISLLYKDTVIKAAKLYARYEQSKNDIENYFKQQNNILEYKSNEKAFDDKYLNNMHNLMREVELAESEIERIHKERVIPLYNKIKELVLLKKNSSMVTFYVIKYGDGTSVPK